MQYFIGIRVPNSHANVILSIRESLSLKTTEPHITVIPPNILPNDDIFVNDLIACCGKISQFEAEINDIGQFENRVIFFKVNSEGLISLKNKIVDTLNLSEEKRSFIPHLTILKRKYMNKINVDKIKQIAKNKLSNRQRFKVTSLIVYQQKTDGASFLPYMEIPLITGTYAVDSSNDTTLKQQGSD